MATAVAVESSEPALKAASAVTVAVAVTVTAAPAPAVTALAAEVPAVLARAASSLTVARVIALLDVVLMGVARVVNVFLVLANVAEKSVAEVGVSARRRRKRRRKLSLLDLYAIVDDPSCRCRP